MKKKELIKKIIVLFFCILMLSQTVPIIVAMKTINTNKKCMDVNQEVGTYNFFGLLIGKIKDVHRFSNKDYITCQAVSVYYDGIVIIRPPHAIDELKGWLFSGEIKIFRPYIGILTQHFICAYVSADRNVFYPMGFMCKINL